MRYEWEAHTSTCIPDYQHERITDFVSTESRPGLTYTFKVPRASELCNLCYKLFLSPSSHASDLGMRLSPLSSFLHCQCLSLCVHVHSGYMHLLFFPSQSSLHWSSQHHVRVGGPRAKQEWQAWSDSCQGGHFWRYIAEGGHFWPCFPGHFHLLLIMYGKLKMDLQLSPQRVFESRAVGPG